MTTIEQIDLYGEYNWEDPIYKLLRRETASPRFKVMLMKKGIASQLFFQFTDAKALHTRSGVDLDELFRRQRRLMFQEGITTEENTEMKENFTVSGLPHTDVQKADFNYGPVWCG